ncbi:acetyl-CoA carboxylase carboxyl transferase subunit alpha [Candidatus Marinamargulisbacteria bacterium SCGC AG-410-N11]|nr:acetyl-CoA carboxylase carboxyl transferase subunit alpha [Candidatus Marinamargulisbacteria bacterium SCGC AG-410-N11]
MAKSLEFERPLLELYDKIEQLKGLSNGNDNLADEITQIEKRAEKMRKEIYSNLTPNQIIQIARHPNRPDSLSLARLICDNFFTLHGDRVYRDDPSIIGGIGFVKKSRVMLIGHQKGHGTKENIYRNFGMPHPEGYRKALRLMKLAEKFGIPIITLIDTPGAFPGIEAEQRGQAEAIARNLKEMSDISVPIISFVIGEGGSGGALAIGVSNKMYMLEYSVYSVISPEGCASILFRDAKKADIASLNLKITAKDVLKLGVIDEIIKEPLGGAHNSWKKVASTIKRQITKDLNEFNVQSEQEIKDQRYNKFRQMGRFTS